ncbi:hypothetical protein Tsubulata_006700 [Turnera subulata]|uniref:Uncharacterized protein n=1 Tax=Turnera subulata TaxID=218843 RepID=A0A9Q0GKB7_9ROSI|nr:hypothetical protein Tsubulata_006700 [Turnera subulata]
MAGATGGGGGAGEFMLFGVRVVVDSMRKSVSLNNLSQYEQPQDLNNNNNKESGNNGNGSNNGKEDGTAAAGGYASADDAVPNSGSGSRSERKRGVPWTEEEHKLFLLGLQRVGKGDWRGISRNFVKTRTPTQVASHAQKYFLRRSNLNRRRRRSSLFDITTDTVTAIPMEEEQAHLQENKINNAPQPHPLLPAPTSSVNAFHVMPALSMASSPVVLPVQIESPMESLSLGHGSQAINPSTSLIRPIPVLPAHGAPTISDLNLNLKSAVDPSTLSLKLSLPSEQRETSSRHSAFQAMSGFSNGDSIISVA